MNNNSLNPMMLLLLMGGLGGSSSGSSKNTTDALLYTSNMFPEMMRMLLAIQGLKARDDQAAKDLAARDTQAADLAKKLAAEIKTAIGKVNADKKIPEADINQLTNLKDLLVKNLTTAEYDALIVKTTTT